MKKYILAHDIGTSGNKATLFDEDGKMIASEVFSYSTHYFNGNWVEQNAEDWWQAVCTTSKNLLSRINGGKVAAVCFSGQMMGSLCVDADGNPLRPSIIWADSRAQKQVDEINSNISQYDFYKISGHRNTVSYGIQKLMWVRDNEPEIYARTYKSLNAKDFIIHRLTGNFYTDYSDGGGNGCFDITKLNWSDEILKCAGIDRDKMPEAVSSVFTAGEVTEKAAALCGIAAGTPVIMGGGDGVTANVGAGSVSPGKTYCIIGTSAWISATSDTPDLDDDMRTVTWVHAVPGMYALNGTMQYAGGSYSWFKKMLADSDYDSMNALAAESAPGSGGVIFLPYMLGERAPRWDAEAKGAFIGLIPETTRGDMIRSVMEGATLNLSIILEIMRKTLSINEITVLGGGAKGEVWRQIMADIFNAEIAVPAVLEEACSIGAAVTGGVGAGMFSGFDAVERFVNISGRHRPNPQAVKAYEPIKEKFEAYYYALKGVM